MVGCTTERTASRVCRIACLLTLVCLAWDVRPASTATGVQALQNLLSFTDLAATHASNDSIAFLNDLAAAVTHTAQSGLQIVANAPSRVAEAFGRSQALVATQFASSATPLSASITQHPIPAYPDTLFTWSVCGTYNPYLVISVRDQEVPLINVDQPVNESSMSFAISSWSEIAYHDPSLVQYNFKIAEDLIYDVTNDTFAVATPFDVKNGKGQIPGVSSVGHSTHNSSMGAPSDDDMYNIKFTFAASPPAKTGPSTGSAQPEGGSTAASNVSAPGEGVQRLLTGQIKDTDIKGRATDAFTELVARLYFNIVTAALGNLCSTGYAQLVPVATYVLNRLSALNSGDTLYNGMPLNEGLIDDGSGRLCMQESNTLYNGASMTLVNTLIAFSAQDCCHACRLTEQANTTGVCNAWIYCGNAAGCHNITENYGAGFNMCSLYYASDLDYNVPLDKNVGVARAPNVTFTSGRTKAIIPDNIMSILVPSQEGSTVPIDPTPTFQSRRQWSDGQP